MHPSTLDELAEASWRLVATNNPEDDALAPWSDPDGQPAEAYTENQADRVRQILLKAAEKKLEMLQGWHAELPDLASIRAPIIDEQCVVASKEGLALMRYEGMHDRAFRANLNQLIKLRKEGPGLVEEGDPGESKAAPNEATASGREDAKQNIENRCAAEVDEKFAPAGVAEEDEEAAAVAGAPIEATEGEVGKADRDRGGRIWPVGTAVEGPDRPPTPIANS